MDEVSENRQGTGVRVFERERDGIANAEAHAEVGRAENTHRSSLHRELFSVKSDVGAVAGAPCAEGHWNNRATLPAVVHCTTIAVHELEDPPRGRSNHRPSARIVGPD